MQAKHNAIRRQHRLDLQHIQDMILEERERMQQAVWKAEAEVAELQQRLQVSETQEH